MKSLKLSILDSVFAVCRMEQNAPLPAWATMGEFFSVVRTADELSVVCPGVNVPEDVKCEKGWRCFKVEGPLDFSLTGVLSSIAGPLASAKVSIFAISTFDTDYILVKSEQLDRAVTILREAGFRL